MPAESELTINERRKYLKLMHPRYWNADRKGRSQLLDEMEQVTKLHRKSLIRLLRAPTLERKRRRTGRGRKYGSDVQYVVWVVWESLDFICAERLTPSLLETAKHLERFKEVTLTGEIEANLDTISRATVQRMIGRMHREKPRLPRSSAEKANSLRRSVPMERLPWDIKEPGHFEADLVHHSGPTAAGDYVHTLQLIDIATGWSERAALLGRSQWAMEQAFRTIVRRLPFPILHLHPDNGSEFFSNNLFRIVNECFPGVKISRSRPYQKNDNRFVEQKNHTLVREYFGNVRLDTKVQMHRMNHQYERMWVYYNFFQPVFHLIGKEYVDKKMLRRWDVPISPYRRLLSSGVLGDEEAARLGALYAKTNPRKLRHEIHAAIPGVWDGRDELSIKETADLISLLRLTRKEGASASDQ